MTQSHLTSRRLVIHHENAVFDKALDDASWVLNSAGMRLYHEAIALLWPTLGKMYVHLKMESSRKSIVEKKTTQENTALTKSPAIVPGSQVSFSVVTLYITG